MPDIKLCEFRRRASITLKLPLLVRCTRYTMYDVYDVRCTASVEPNQGLCSNAVDYPCQEDGEKRNGSAGGVVCGYTVYFTGVCLGVCSNRVYSSANRSHPAASTLAIHSLAQSIAHRLPFH